MGSRVMLDDNDGGHYHETENTEEDDVGQRYFAEPTNNGSAQISRTFMN
jgi:hypothetical protein